MSLFASNSLFIKAKISFITYNKPNNDCYRRGNRYPDLRGRQGAVPVDPGDLPADGGLPAAPEDPRAHDGQAVAPVEEGGP